MRNVLWVSMLIVTAVSVQAAIVNPLDSAAFLYKYEGDAITQNGSTASGFGNTGYAGSMTGSTLVSDGDVLSVATTGPGVLYLQNSMWDTEAERIAINSSGWTWEARMKIKSATGYAAFYLRIGDDATNEEIFMWTLDRMRGYSTDGWGLLNTTDTFHVYRVSQAPNSNVLNVWIDGVLASEHVGALGGHDDWWSDGSGSTGGSYDLDYMRWTTGGYSPIPEPATLALLALGGIRFMKRRS